MKLVLIMNSRQITIVKLS